jgi:hypothetical protein|tara:strand:- start:210 stop:1328 length:1119 start_codon:yes stop_codon:yes gene_type:complete
MATYLVLSNSVLNELNEVELTSANFSSSRGVQTSVKGFINKSINDIYNQVWELPSLYKSTKQNTYGGTRTYSLPATDSPQSGDIAFRRIDWDSFRLVPKELVTNGEFTSNITSWSTIAGSGSAAYTSTGNGRLRLNDYAAYQTLTTTVNTTYRIQLKVFDTVSVGQPLKVQVGTSAEDTTNLSTTLTVTDYGAGAVLDTTFTATAQTTYITVNNTTTSTNLDVDYIRISEDVGVKKLRYMTYDDWNTNLSEKDLRNSSGNQGIPDYVYFTQSGKFGLSPIPKDNSYSIQYEYWKVHTDLSSHGDTPDLEGRYQDIIVNRAKYYLYKLRSDIPSANIANAEFEEGVKRIRLDLVEKSSYMRDSRVNLTRNTMR